MKSEMTDQNGKLSVLKLRAIGILWCTADNNQKVHELFENILPGLQNDISSNDKNQKINLLLLLDLATEMVFRLEPLFKNCEIEISA